MISTTPIRASSLCKLTLGALLMLPATGFAQDTCVEMGGLAWDSWWETSAGGPGNLPAGVQNKDYVRCKACHGWDGLGTDGGYVRRSRKDTRPNAGFGDGDQTSRSVRSGAVTAEMIGHEDTGRSYADGTGSFVELDMMHMSNNRAQHANGYTLGNQHPDFSANGINGDDLVLSQNQMDCLAAFMNFDDGDPAAYFSAINPGRNPVLYTLRDGADSVAGEAIYTARCQSCHGAPDDESGGPVAQAPSGGLLAYLQSDGKFSEFAHKVRWGIPDTIMTRASLSSPSSQEVVDLMKYLQDLSGTGYAITPGVSGTWFDAGHDGEGFLIDVGADSAAKGSAVMVAAYYTYDDVGGQAWMIGSGTIDGDSVVLDMFITDGGIFGSAFDPANVNRTAWGTLGFTFSNCGNGVVTATPNAANQPTFETTSYPITRVVAPGNICP